MEVQPLSWLLNDVGWATRQGRPEARLQSRQCGAWPCYPNPQAEMKVNPNTLRNLESHNRRPMSGVGKAAALPSQNSQGGEGSRSGGERMWGQPLTGTGETSQGTQGCRPWETARHKVTSRNPGRPCEESAELEVPVKRGNSRGGKELYFG